MNLEYGFKWNPIATVEKFDDDAVEYVRRRTGVANPEHDLLVAHVEPYELLTVEGNLLTTAGLDRLTKCLIDGATQVFDATHVRVGVGDDTTAAAVGDTDLSTGSNQYYTLPDSTYPQQSNGTLTMKGTFATGEANFAWQCWGLDAGTADSASATAPLLNRKVASLGTKSSGTWTITVTLVFS